MASAVPNEILLIIFNAVTSPKPLPWPNAIYDRERAKAPFTLSRICQRWRRLARNRSSLWTYFGFTGDIADAAVHAHLDRLKLLQALSKNHPLDIVFRWDLPLGSNAVRRNYRIQIVDALNKVGSRWRNVTLALNSALAPRLDVSMSGSSPELETLSVRLLSETTYLPCAPRLQRLYVEAAGGNKGYNATTAYNRWPSLTSLATFTNDQTLHRATCATLRELCILASLDRPKAASLVTLPLLTSLTLNDAEHLNAIDAPNLRSLTINCRAIYSVDSTSLTRFTAVVQHLGIFNSIEPSVVEYLAKFSIIESFTVEQPSMARWRLGSPHFGVKSRAFAQLAAVEPPVWPKLQHMRITDCYFNDLDIDAKGEGLFDFIHARTSVGGFPQEVDGPVQLRSIDIDPKLPPSLYARLRELGEKSSLLVRPIDRV
ncbi:hypothetical protein BKA62DRAFT_836529 [Auriculariales sp. MPI-PUGE-AT-0066]|nr:hypothetical protein BKA62DRAFT_836529 [Auriculariales sp. MPI-PUGE-AT-0066]